jgi:hypothetical protein
MLVQWRFVEVDKFEVVPLPVQHKTWLLNLDQAGVFGLAFWCCLLLFFFFFFSLLCESL